MQQSSGSPRRGDSRLETTAPRSRQWSWWYLLLLVQCLAVIWPPFYNRAEPPWLGIPFFYWYQLLWILLGAVLTALVYFVTERTRR